MSLRKTKDAKIVYGDVHVPDEAFEPKACRRRISIWISEEVIQRLKVMADKESIGYQTLINRLLEDEVRTEKHSVIARLDRIEKLVAAGSKR